MSITAATTTGGIERQGPCGSRLSLVPALTLESPASADFKHRRRARGRHHRSSELKRAPRALLGAQ